MAVVEEELAAQIDDVVKEQVAACLGTHIPPELQDEVVENNEELEKVRMALHNSYVLGMRTSNLISTDVSFRESRRANADLRSNKPDALLHTIYMSDGKVSPAFPNDLKSLFGLDGELFHKAANAKSISMDTFEQGRLAKLSCFTMNCLIRLNRGTGTSIELCNFAGSSTNWWTQTMFNFPCND